MVETFGIISSLVIIASFLMDNPIKIRVVNSIGGVMFLIYGILIGSISTVFLQCILVLVQFVKIKHTKNKGE